MIDLWLFVSVILIYLLVCLICLLILICILGYSKYQSYCNCKRNFEDIFNRTKDIHDVSKSPRWVIYLSQWLITLCLWLYCIPLRIILLEIMLTKSGSVNKYISVLCFLSMLMSSIFNLIYFYAPAARHRGHSVLPVSMCTSVNTSHIWFR